MIQMHGGARRALALAGAIVLATAAGLVAITLPASAAASSLVKPSTWAYTDSRAATTPFINPAGDAPVGARRDDDGKLHKSRSYFSYDLTGFAGKTIVSAEVSMPETAANDCSATRNLELWRTAAISADTTWANPPPEHSKIAAFGGLFCPGHLAADLTDLVQGLVAGGATSLTLELRVPADAEGSMKYGRHVRSDAWILIKSNTAPGTPRNLSLDNMACGSGQPIAVRQTSPTMLAYLEDPDVANGGIESVRPAFAVWPVDHPDQRFEWELSFAKPAPSWWSSYVPAGVLSHGGTYAMTVRSFDGTTWSPWSDECRFSVDTQRPATPPSVTSTDYPQGGQWTGGPGIAGDFTFTAGGVSDVTGYRFGLWGANEYVAAPSPGAPVTVSITPTSDGPVTLYVYSVDAAGNSSNETRYSFRVRPTAPLIVDQDPDAWVGEAHELLFQPNMDDVVSYTWWTDGQPEQTVAAAADGTARITVTPPADGVTVYVRSTTATGLPSGTNWFYLYTSGGPVVTSTDFPSDGRQGISIGSEGSFVITSRTPNVVEYVVQFNRGLADELASQTFPTNGVESVIVPFTATRAGYNTIHVLGRKADGVESTEIVQYFAAASIAPQVDSSTYPDGLPGGGPGITGTFTFSPSVAGVVEYLYTFRGEPERSVPAAADGTASIDWTPLVYHSETGGWLELLVRSRSANGLISDPAYHSIGVHGFEPIITGPGDAPIGQPVQLTLVAQLAGSVEFVYFTSTAFGDQSPEQGVAVGPDGTTTVTFVMASYWDTITVRSRTATGVTSAYGTHSIFGTP